MALNHSNRSNLEQLAVKGLYGCTPVVRVAVADKTAASLAQSGFSNQLVGRNGVFAIDVACVIKSKRESQLARRRVTH